MLRVLHVDDYEDDFELLRNHLRRLKRDLEIDWAQSGADALDRLDRDRVDCILSDYQMPLMDGLQLLKAVRARGDSTPFIFFTGQGNEQIVAEALRAGADDYFSKEVGFVHYERLLNSIEKVIYFHRLNESREQAETALSKAEERMRAYFAGVYDMVYFKGLDGALSMLNQANVTVTGYSLAEFERNPHLWREIVHAHDVEAADEFFASNPEGAPSLEVEYRLQRKDGEWRWMRSRMVGVKDESGRYVGYNCIDRDITEMRKAEERIRQQSGFLKDVLSALAQPFYVINAEDYSIALANEAAGFGEIEAGATCHALTHRKEEPCGGRDCPCPLEMVKATKKPARVEHVHQNRDGAARRFEIEAFPVLDDSGEVVQMIEHAVDVTDHRRLQEELQESEERFRTLVELNADGVVIVDGDGVVRFANPAAEALLGSGEGELIGRQIRPRISDEGETKLDVVGRGRVLGVAELRVAEVRWNRQASQLISLRGTCKCRTS